MSNLYHCFKQSDSIAEFKSMVFKNRIRTRFCYVAPLKDLLIENFETDGALDLLCDLLSDHRTFQETQALIERAMENYYAEALAEYDCYPSFEEYCYENHARFKQELIDTLKPMITKIAA